MVIATFSLPAEALALEEMLANISEIEIEAERIAAHSTEWVMPCLWIKSDDFDAVDSRLREDPSVDNIVETNEFDHEKYYHLEWSDAVEGRINAYVDKGGSVLEAHATAKGWEVEFSHVGRVNRLQTGFSLESVDIPI